MIASRSRAMGIKSHHGAWGSFQEVSRYFHFISFFIHCSVCLCLSFSVVCFVDCLRRLLCRESSIYLCRLAIVSLSLPPPSLSLTLMSCVDFSVRSLCPKDCWHGNVWPVRKGHVPAADVVASRSGLPLQTVSVLSNY